MAKGTYLSENLNERQINFLKYLSENEILYFRINQLKNLLPQSLSNINDLVENLYKKKLLYRIEKGVYAIFNFKKINVLATFISKNSSIAYWSALHYHGLTERFPNTIFIKTTQRKRDTEIFGSSIQFITVKESKNMGVEKIEYGDDSFIITNLEMTFVDCFDQMRYAGDFPHLIKAFAHAKLTNRKLIHYTKTYQNIALTKKLGFLAELFHQKQLSSFIEFAKQQVNNRYNLIDAGGKEEGEFINNWKIRLNVSKKQLLEMVKSEY